MSNSPLATVTILSPNCAAPRAHVIDRITPHCVVGQCSVEALGNLFANRQRNASSNYGIGTDGRIGLYVSEANRSWCSSDTKNDDRAVTIECASDTVAPWAFNEAVYNSLVNLCVDICKRNVKTRLLWLKDKDLSLAYNPRNDEMVLTVHRWFANKACPGDWMMDRMPDLAARVTAALTNENKNWYDDAMAFMRDEGLMMDGRPNDPITRAELAMVFYRKFGPSDEKNASGLLVD